MLESIRETILKRKPAALARTIRSARSWIRTRGETQRMLPSFVILGGQRCGTTSLYRYLLEHPDIHPALVKEIQFFTLNYARGVDWYRSNFPPVSAGGQSFDASPYYLFHPKAAERAAAVLPDAKLVALLRHPVDRAFSHYRHNVGLGVEDLTFEAALEAEEARLAGEESKLQSQSDYSSAAHRRYSYLARGEYANQLQRWLEHFDRGQLLVVISEEFFADSAATFGAVLEFLELPPLVLSRYAAYTRRGRWDGPGLNPETRVRLQDRFREPNRELEALLGRNLPWEDK